MAIIIESTYGKTIGLPQFSSHRFDVKIKSEIQNIETLPQEAQRVYQILQASIDEQIKNIGYSPASTKGTEQEKTWQCSEKQRQLTLDVMRQNNLEHQQVNQLALDLFNKQIEDLNKLEASALLSDLLQKYSKGSGNKQYARRS